MDRPELSLGLRPFFYVPFKREPNILTFGLLYIRNFLIAFGLSALIASGVIVAGGDERSFTTALPIAFLLSSSEEIARFQFFRFADRPFAASMKFALIINAIELTAAWWTMVSAPGSFFSWSAFAEARGGAFVFHFLLSLLLFCSLRLNRPLAGLLVCVLVHSAFNIGLFT